MSEINGSNIGVNHLNQTPNTRQNQINEQPPKSPEETEQLKDFSDAKAETLGRSMLFKGVDNTNHDLKILLENPQVAENSDKVFEAAYAAAKEAGLENPYEEAASASTTAM